MQNIIELARDMAKKYTVRNVLIASLGDGAKMAAQVFGTEHYTIHAIGNPEDTNDAAVAEKIQNLENGLAQASMDWAHQHGWLRLEIHRVYTGSGTCSPAWGGLQKGCRPFWEKLGFKIFRVSPRDETLATCIEAAREWYGKDLRTEKEASHWDPGWETNWQIFSMVHEK